MTSVFEEAAAKAETVKHSQKSESARRQAKLEKDNADLHKIVPALYAGYKKLEARVAELERFNAKLRGAKLRVGKVPKKKD